MNNIISSKADIGKNTIFMHNCIVEDNVIIGDNCYIDSNTIIRSGTRIGNGSFIGSNCIMGEYLADFCTDNKTHEYVLAIGENALIRSGSILYTDSVVGEHFQTGHRVTIREGSEIGNHVSIGTLSDIQGYCKIGSYVNMHSNVHIAQKSQIEDYVWLFPYVVLTNDPTPPTEELKGVYIHSFAIVASHSVILPGIDIASDSLVAAGAVVTKDVEQFSVVGGNPAKKLGDIRDIRNHETGDVVYPWRYHFKRKMPWEKTGFVTWISNLSQREIEEYHVTQFI